MSTATQGYDGNLASIIAANRTHYINLSIYTQLLFFTLIITNPQYVGPLWRCPPVSSEHPL